MKNLGKTCQIVRLRKNEQILRKSYEVSKIGPLDSDLDSGFRIVDSDLNLDLIGCQRTWYKSGIQRAEIMWCYSVVESSNRVNVVQPSAVDNPSYIYANVPPRPPRSQPSQASGDDAASSTNNLAAQVGLTALLSNFWMHGIFAGRLHSNFQACVLKRVGPGQIFFSFLYENGIHLF